MKYLCCLLFVFLLNFGSFAQRVSFNRGEISGRHYYQEIPYKFVNGRTYLVVEINGVKRRFLFDTGAPTQITAGLFEELKPQVINKTDITDAAGNKTALDIVSLQKFELQGLVFENIPALVTSSELYGCLGIDGVIGINGVGFDNVITETAKSNNSRIGTRLLEYGMVTMDFIHHLFYFDAVRSANDLKEELWPVKPVIEQGKLVVGSLGIFKGRAKQR